MMKKLAIKLLVSRAAIAGANSAKAQENNSWFKKGYSSEYELATAHSFNQNSFATSQGYSFGNGLYVGGGAAFEYAVSDNIYMTPVFAELRWSVLDKVVSPYLDVKAGYLIIIADKPGSFYLAPSVGLDICKRG
ncbi:MAG: hypothetical protein ACI3ZK_03115 [Candidatus Cryptobacteroides sp.]